LTFSGVSKDDYLACLKLFYERNEPGPAVEMFTKAYIDSAKNYDLMLAHNPLPDEVIIENRSFINGVLKSIIERKLPKSQIEEFICQMIDQSLEGLNAEKKSSFTKRYRGST
jgi:hypothetical protein